MPSSRFVSAMFATTALPVLPCLRTMPSTLFSTTLWDTTPCLRPPSARPMPAPGFPKDPRIEFSLTTEPTFDSAGTPRFAERGDRDADEVAAGDAVAGDEQVSVAP